MTHVQPLIRERVDFLIEKLEPTVESDNIYYHSLRAARAAGELDRMSADELCSLANWLEGRLTLATKVRELITTTAERPRAELREKVDRLKEEILSIDPFFAFPWDSLTFEQEPTSSRHDFTQRRRIFHQASNETSVIGRRAGLFAAVFISTIIIVLLLT